MFARMKSLFVFILGIVIGALGCNLYLKRDTTPPPEFVEATPGSDSAHGGHAAPAQPETAGSPESRTFGERAADTTTDIKKSLSTKAQEWRLTPDDIKRELADGGKVVRQKAGAVGGKISDVRIITIIKSKYVLDRDLSAMDITVECKNGHVILSGNVATVDHVAKAITHAMDTDGVVNVASHLRAPVL